MTDNDDVIVVDTSALSSYTVISASTNESVSQFVVLTIKF